MSELGIIFAVASALTANVAVLCKHRGATMAPTIRFTRPLESAIALFRSKWWLIGFAVAAVAWGFHVVAMALAPLSMVQVVTAGGLALLALPAQRFFGIRLGRREWAGLCLSAFGLAWLALTAEASEVHSAYSLAALLAFEGALVAVGAMLLHRGSNGARPCAKRRPARRRGRDPRRRRQRLDEGAHRRSCREGLIALVSPWSVLTICAGLLAFFALARGLQIGPPDPGHRALVDRGQRGRDRRRNPRLRRSDRRATRLGSSPASAAFCAVIAAAVLIPAPRTSEGTPAVA